MSEFSRRLEVVFGSRLSDVNRAHIESLVTNDIPEDFDLDFKSGLYGSNDGSKRDLAGDVAALANTAGGVIVLGVAEDAQARASATLPVAMSDAEVRRMRLIVASNVAPVPPFEIVPIPSSETTGFYLVVVSRSPSAPHGLLVNEGFRYPVRNGSTTRYLSEPEVATAYRERFRGAGRQADRAAEVVTESRTALAAEAGWLVMCLVPQQPGSMEITGRGFIDFQQWTATAPRLQVNDSLHRHRVASRRYVAHGGTQDTSAHFVLLEAHVDGTGVYAVQVTDDGGSVDAETGRVSNLLDQTLAAGLMAGLKLLASHAQENAHASGPALLRVELIPAAQVNAVRFPGSSGGAFSVQSHLASAAGLKSVEVSTTIEDLMLPDQTLPATAAALLHQLGEQFGLPEVAMIQRNGSLNRVDWAPTWQSLLETWATTAAVDLAWSTS